MELLTLGLQQFEDNLTIYSTILLARNKAEAIKTQDPRRRTENLICEIEDLVLRIGNCSNQAHELLL